MRRRLFALAGLAILVMPIAGRAETLTYDQGGSPLFSITFPDGWFLDTDFVDEAKAAGSYEGGEPEIRILEAMPGDGTKLWFGIWVVPRAKTLEEGLEYMASLDGDLFTDVEASEVVDAELGSMIARTFHGTARRQDEDVEFAVALFEPRAEVIAVALYVGRPQTWEKHQDELAQIVESLEPAGT